VKLKPILLIISVTMIAMGDLMLIPAAVAWLTGMRDAEPFLASALIILPPALLIYALCRRARPTVLPRQAFLATTLVWIIAAAAGALPIALHEHATVTDAVFESMSGITTTGSTVLVGLDDMAPAILLWRSLLQWVGGLGFILMAVAILPLVGVGGMRLFRSESSDWSSKSLPRTRDIAIRIAALYGCVTAVCAAVYWGLGMSAFDAVNHAMTTLATGGYSTSDASFGKYDNNAMLWSGTIFMLLASLPFVAYLRALRVGASAVIGDDQVRFFLGMVLVAVSIATFVLIRDSEHDVSRALTLAAFNLVSTITTTGYASTDYTLWGPFFIAAFLFLMFTGGCSGSTSGSIKAFRLQIALQTLGIQIRKLVHPTGVFIARHNGDRVDPDVVSALIAFIFAVGVTVMILTLALTAMGLDLVTSLSGAATAITNVGPGLGDVIGPAGNFASLPDPAKWLLAAAMLLGRLELMTVIVLLSRPYWRA
jgi:trk system potassium uptake protein